MLMAALKIAVETNLLEYYSKNSKFGSTSEGKKVPTSNIKLKQMCVFFYLQEINTML